MSVGGIFLWMFCFDECYGERQKIKKSGRTIFVCLFLMLGVNITVVVFLIKDKEIPEDTGSMNTENVSQLAEEKTITEGKEGRLVLSELELS